MRNELSVLDYPFKSILLNSDWDDLMGFSKRDISLPLDFEEKEDRFLISIDMPGISKKDIRIEFNKDSLVVKAERKENVKNYSEKRYGSFQRTIKIPHGVSGDKINARFKDGVLILDMLKEESVKTRMISVE